MGKMGKALLAGWQQDSQLDATFTVVDPALNSSSHHSEHGIYISCPNRSGYHPELVVLAVKPQMMASVLAACLALGMTPGFLSIAAGLSTNVWRSSGLPAGCVSCQILRPP